MSIEAIQNFTSYLSDVSENVIVEENSTLSQKAHPNSIKTRAKELFHEVSNASLESSERANRYSTLEKGLDRYIGWMEKNESALRSIVDDYSILAPKIRSRASKTNEQAKKALQPQEKKPSPEIPKSIHEAVVDFQSRLEAACINVILGAKSTLPQELKPTAVQKEAEAFSQHIQSLQMEKNKKADLLKKVAGGLRSYANWMQKNKTVLEEKIPSFIDIEQKIKNASNTIKKTALRVLEVQAKPIRKEVPEQFKKLYSPKSVSFSDTLDDLFDCQSSGFFNSVQLQSLFGAPFLSFSPTSSPSSLTTTLKTVVQELQNDKEIARVLEGWHKQKGSSQALIPFLQKELEEGVCFGRVMTYIEQIKAQYGTLNMKSLYNRATEKDFIKYQILHYLRIFSHNSISTRMQALFAESSTGVYSKIVKRFPVEPPEDANKKQIAMDSTLLAKRLTEELSNDDAKRTAIICNFEKHVCLIYCNPQYDTYFYYDSISQQTGGLFTANSKKALVNGAVKQLMECASLGKYPSVAFHRYEI